MARQYLNVPYRQKDEAKRLGARFDWDVKRWYVTPGVDLSLFTRWLPVEGPSPAGALTEPAEPETRRGIPLSALLRDVSTVIARRYEQAVWTLVEINEVHLRRHVYLEVSERDEQGRAVARARAMIWASTAQKILPAFEKETGAVLAAGVKLLVLIQPRFHEQYGFSLQIEAIDAQYVLGYLEARRREIRSRLHREGVFENNRRLPAPWGFSRVVVIAPEKAAGLGDFQKEADRLQRYGICHFFYAFSRFQGEGAAREIIAALESILQEPELVDSPPDAVVFVRGGGATNDLAWLEDYDLVRTVCDLTIPVFVGIGHERDRLLLDEVAHTSFDTPSKVIAGIEQRIQQQAQEAVAAMQTIADRARATLTARRGMLQQLNHQMTRQAWETLDRAASQSDQLYHYVTDTARGRVHLARHGSQRLLVELHAGAWRHVGSARQQTRSHISLLHERAYNTVSTGRQLTESLLREIIGQGPEQTLARGFAIARDATDKPVMSAHQASSQTSLTLQFKDGFTRVKTEKDTRH